MFRQAIDRAIAGALTAKQFDSILRAQGFEMKLTDKYWTIKMTGDKRPTRLYQLEERYSGEAIKRRILENGRPRVFIPAQPSSPKQYRLIGNFHTTRKITGFRALYFYYLYRMGLFPKSKPRPPSNPILWEDVRQMRKYREQARLLADNKIDTPEQLKTFVDTTKGQLDDFVRQRTLIQNKLRREKKPEVIEELKVKKAIITQHIALLRRKLKSAYGIEERSVQMKEKLDIIRQSETSKQTKQKQSKHRGGQVYAR